MFLAIPFSEYNGADDTLDEHDKVEWVRRILHDHSSGSSDASVPTTPSIDVSVRKIDEIQKSSPQFTEASPHPNSTDSGFVSSGSAATPGNAPGLDAVSPSLKDIATILANALSQTQSTEHASRDSSSVDSNKSATPSENPNVELAAKALLEVCFSALLAQFSCLILKYFFLFSGPCTL